MTNESWNNRRDARGPEPEQEVRRELPQCRRSLHALARLHEVRATGLAMRSPDVLEFQAAWAENCVRRAWTPAAHAESAPLFDCVAPLS